MRLVGQSLYPELSTLNLSASCGLQRGTCESICCGVLRDIARDSGQTPPPGMQNIETGNRWDTYFPNPPPLVGQATNQSSLMDDLQALLQHGLEISTLWYGGRLAMRGEMQLLGRFRV